MNLDVTNVYISLRLACGQVVADTREQGSLFDDIPEDADQGTRMSGALISYLADSFLMGM
jgi:hypothetical protein